MTLAPASWRGWQPANVPQAVVTPEYLHELFLEGHKPFLNTLRDFQLLLYLGSSGVITGPDFRDLLAVRSCADVAVRQVFIPDVVRLLCGVLCHRPRW